MNVNKENFMEDQRYCKRSLSGKKFLSVRTFSSIKRSTHMILFRSPHYIHLFALKSPLEMRWLWGGDNSRIPGPTEWKSFFLEILAMEEEIIMWSKTCWISIFWNFRLVDAALYIFFKALVDAFQHILQRFRPGTGFTLFDLQIQFLTTMCTVRSYSFSLHWKMYAGCFVRANVLTALKFKNIEESSM